MSAQKQYVTINDINHPQDLRNLSIEDLSSIARDIRRLTIETVSEIGGHIGGSLGVVELTIALHYVFDTPNDLLIWDIGHQLLPHKILTNRRKDLSSWRQFGGLSGFARRTESQFDHFGAGHSSTSISAALGFIVANKIKGSDYNQEVIAIIGDGSLSAGMAFEALNNAANSSIIIILNDNGMSISPAVGSFSEHLKQIDKHDNIFTNLGLDYVGIIDGHNIELLINVLRDIKGKKRDKAIVIHIKTTKGMEMILNDYEDEEGYHSVAPFDPITMKIKEIKKQNVSYSDIFAHQLLELIEKNSNIVAITAAMMSGTGLKKVALQHPDRIFDVGIAEQHAVTFAAGIAANGGAPFVAIFSTFLQRAYDQIIHDVAIQSLPVRFIIDRAGLVGSDGPTHAGSFDIMYLCNIPNFIVMAPSSAKELAAMINLMNNIDHCPSAIRFPRGHSDLEALEGLVGLPKINIGKSNVLWYGEQPIAIFCFGVMLEHALQAIRPNERDYTVIDIRFAKPIDKALIRNICNSHSALLIVEEGSSGGVSTQIVNFILNCKEIQNKPTIRTIYLKDQFIDHGSVERMREEGGLGVQDIKTVIIEVKNGL